jgi:hypothetical protein
MINQKPNKVADNKGKRNVVCSACKKSKPHTHYRWYRKTTNKGVTKRTKWTLNSRLCKECNNINIRTLTKIKKNNDYPKTNRCQCCKNISEHKLHLDHSHGKNGKFRGWICRRCNVGIGFFGDTIVGVKRAVRYLQKS